MSQQQENYTIPSHLDDGMKFFMWEMDEALAFLGPLGFGVLSGMLLLGVMTGIFCAWLVAKVKKGRGTYFVRHLRYWYLPNEKPFKGTRIPPSHIREYTG